MKDRQRQPASGDELLDAGREALARGDSRQAFDLLHRASQAGVAPEALGLLARSFAQAGLFQGRRVAVRDWIEQAIEETRPTDAPDDPTHRSALLHARIVVWRHLDIPRIEEFIDEALQAAEAISDEVAFAEILTHGAYAAYRRGDLRIANRYAARVQGRVFTSREAQFSAIRTQMFAAVVAGDLELAINHSTNARATARELGDSHGMANECNNLAEFYLDLGFPEEGRTHADEAVRLARMCGHRSVELFGESMSANATALIGSIDEALERFSAIKANDPVFAADIAAAHSFWSLERGAAGDAENAADVAQAAIERAERVGASNRLTQLYGNLSRSSIRRGKVAQAQEELETARRAAERAELPSQLLLALAVTEVLPADNPKRRVVLNQARGRILRNAERREDPRAYCVGVRLNRRLLELSGGIPGDLPG